MFLMALIMAISFALAATLIGFVKSDQSNSTIITCGIVSFIIILGFDWMSFQWNWLGMRPIWAGAGWMTPFVVNLIIVGLIFLAPSVSNGFNATPFVAGIMTLIMVVGVLWIWNNWWYGQNNATYLASKLNIERMDQNPDGTSRDPSQVVGEIYPPTDTDHMVIVGEQSARSIASRVMSQGNIATRYTLGEGVLQSVAGHMYYVFDLRSPDTRSAGVANYEASAYIKVDAEDPNVSAQVIDSLDGKPIAIRYMMDGYFDSNLERYVWNKYSDYYVDGLNMEIDDQGRPFWTASLNKSALRMQEGIPVKFITVDAQTGEFKEYALDQIPAWVDRVYSAGTATTMLNWWGRWGLGAPYQPFFEGNAGRFQVNGGLNLVYTDEGPAWQALMSSYGRDNSAQYVALMDTRSNNVRVYPAPEGLQVESNVENAINTSNQNLKGLDATHLTMHKVFGKLVWVGSLVANDTGNTVDGQFPTAQAFQGISLLDATSGGGDKVIIGTSKADAFSRLSAQFANGTTSSDPGTDSNTKTVQGVVTAAQVIVEGGNSTAVIRLVGEKDVQYVGPVTVSDPKTLIRATLKEGDKVTIIYRDSGGDNRNISSLTIDAESLVPVG